ncbi:MAG TPA: PAS domain S-box protein [Fimbriimonadaceae bacterium]|nr:PAS domain S-box protein [Fimbriimonadaceae bacterium]
MRKVAEKVVLSPREEQLIALAGQGLTDTAIANKLGISEATVNTYWGRIRVKLGPHNRTELVALALREEYERRIDEMRGTSPDGPDYSLILQAAPDALILTSDDGTISDANVAAGEMFGYEIDELVGMNIMVLIPAQFRGGHDEHVAGYLSNPERRQMGSHMGVVGLRKDGVEFQMAAALSSISWNGRSMAICSIRHVAG